LRFGSSYRRSPSFHAIDDRIQRRSQGYIVPDAFTHGTSEFKKGLESGDIRQGDTFSAKNL
jgi:predicted metalloprotease